MSRVRRGVSAFKRKNARNFTHEQAQARLQETVAPFNMQVENSLGVNAVEVDYYQAQGRTGKPCSCEKIEIRPEFGAIMDDRGNDTNIPPIVRTVDDDGSSGLHISLQDNDLFGDSEAEKLYGESVIGVDGDECFSDDDIPEEIYRSDINKEGDVGLVETTMFGSNANCGICYKLGFQPGYRAYGKQRHVLTTWDVEMMGCYTVLSAETPNRFKRHGPKHDHCFVEFRIQVPKYFKSCTYSIRNNVELVSNEHLIVDGKKLTADILRGYAGREMVLRTQAIEFSHIVLEFDLGMAKVKANLGPESQAIDYSRLEALSNFPIVLPPSIHEVNNGDIVVIKDRRLVLKVMDKERKITADKRQLEWVVQTRVVQKTEPLKLIAKGIKLI